MRHADLPMPGLLWGDHPERRDTQRRLGERCDDALRALADLSSLWQRRRDALFLARVRAAQAKLGQTGPGDAELRTLRQALQRDGLRGQTLAHGFALVSAVAQRQLGQAPFDAQLIAARAVVENRLAEMATGEGKSLATALAAACAALTGMPVHVVTANDYLVARDAQRMKPFFEALGLRAGWVAQVDDAPRRALAYACDIVYVTAKELVFDYLRDGLAGDHGHALPAPLARLNDEPEHPVAPRLLRGLCMAIIDEADAVLIDEARVPLLLSMPGEMAEAVDHAAQALRQAGALRSGIDFKLSPQAMRAQLSDAGRRRLARAASALDSASQAAVWRNRHHREHSVCTALAALHLYQRDRHYVVCDGKVALIDETTGRIAPGRVWAAGLQQLVEIKEGCEPSPALVTVAQITYQRFFPRYFRLGGLSGTLCEARTELLSTYGLSVRRVVLRRPSRRQLGKPRLFADNAALWAAVTARVAELHRRGSPVLVATDSVTETQALAGLLAAAGLAPAVLHARSDGDEAALVARAGQRGAITVTTNMAGRGTDIALGDGVAALGGLQVICCQLNAARRIDRQLAGRAARQGDPGSVQTWLSLDNPMLARFWPPAMRQLLRRCAAALPGWAVWLLARLPQRFEEQCQREQRRRLIRQDIRMERELGFGGRRE